MDYYTEMVEHRFYKGQRVRLSAYGRSKNLVYPKHLDRSGIIAKVGEFNTPHVLWDGRKTPSSYHPVFIEPDKRRRISQSVRSG